MPTLPLFDLLRRAAVPALCLLVAAYFGVHALFGTTGILALDDIRADHAAGAAEQHRLKERRAALQQSIVLLDPQGADPDYADELVRRHLGVVRPDEVIIPLGPVGTPD